jgi:Ca2+-binding RTX toxin-like protein
MAKGSKESARTRPAALDDEALDGVSGGFHFAGTEYHVGTHRPRSDEFTLGGENDHIKTGAGNDTVHAGAGDDYAHGGTGADALDGEAGKDRLDGGLGDDTLNGGRGDDRMFGGWGSDTFVITRGDGNDYVDGQKEVQPVINTALHNTDTILLDGIDWKEVKVEFTNGNFAGGIGPDGTQKLTLNAAGFIIIGDQKIEFSNIEQIKALGTAR